ncbi:MAG TPA: anthranilate phosphoribosyltransferase, partial [Methylomirabilota bacterium]|nr:anthranilate phosphoribosyltransferase [Methylomirabilota bacterium]
AAMRHVGPSRVELGTRTIFNLLGPLSNPAGVRRQLVGVFAQQWLEPVAKVLRGLGSERVWVVHGSDGMDEITASGVTFVTSVEDGRLRSFEIAPEDVGLPRHPPEAVTGGTAEDNAKALRELLAGEPGAYRDTVLMNAGAALVIAGAAADLREGVARSAEAIDSGKAAEVLARLVAETNAVS